MGCGALPVSAAGANATTAVHRPPARACPAGRWLLAVALGAIALIALVAVVRSPRGASDASALPAPPSGGHRRAPHRCASVREHRRFFRRLTSPTAWPTPCAAKLAELRSLEVIARGSSVPYVGGKVRPADVARDLGVRYLLTGTVRWAKQADGVSSRGALVPQI